MVKNRTVYRDKRTGRFVKKSTWQRSKRQGGKRYRRETISPHKNVTWAFTFDYDKIPGAEFDGEMRVTIDYREFPDYDPDDRDGAIELVTSVLEGESVDGISVEFFEVRNQDVTDKINDGDWQSDTAASFIVSAKRIPNQKS